MMGFEISIWIDTFKAKEQEFKNWIREHSFLTTMILFICIKFTMLFIFIELFNLLGETVWDNNYPRFHSGIEFFDLLGTRWDSNIYIPMAENGYAPINSSTDYRAWVFPPLYPFLINILVQISPIELHYTVSAVIITNIFSVTSVMAFYLMARHYLDEIKSIYATLFFAFFPPVFVFSTVAYSEPIYLTFVILSWYFFEKQRYPLAGLFLAISTFARYEGALFFFLYAAIYLGRCIRERDERLFAGSLLAIPFFPVIILIKTTIIIRKRVLSFRKQLSLTYAEKIKSPEEPHQILDFLNTELSWVLIWGIFPLLWLLHIDATAPLPLGDLRKMFWGADFDGFFSGFFEMLGGGDIRWTLEKYSFVFLIAIIGFFPLRKWPSLSLSIIGQVILYASYSAAGWSIVRYIGSVFHPHVVLTDELSNSPKIFLLILSFFLLYSFKVLWSFTHWSLWLI
ncbi:hypothetical protein CEE45_12705 [Candidatus Heimdallarchaeota archaeon B3_Heim]|nr:MAG: hypothetical protein CEE45_12705 [Candidatus Heimdallarchaeota archaeon B3_Heim]